MAAAGGGFRFAVVSTELVTDTSTNETYVTYTCEISVGDLPPHRISLRYSELRKIHEDLRSALPFSLPDFPSRRFDIFSRFHTIDPDTVKQRSEQLNAYYSSLFSNPAWITCEKLHNLFQLPQSHRIAIIQRLMA